MSNYVLVTVQVAALLFVCVLLIAVVKFRDAGLAMATITCCFGVIFSYCMSSWVPLLLGYAGLYLISKGFNQHRHL